MPSTDVMGLSEWHAPVVERVQLSTDAAQGDIYENDKNDDKGPGKKWRLTAQALNKISMCAGVIWPPDQNYVEKLEKNYVSYRAVGGLRKPDGSPIFYKATYDLDLEVIEMELQEQYEAKSKWMKRKGKDGKEHLMTDEEKAEYVTYCVKRDLLQKRKHKVSLCETGAKDRVIRKLLGLKNAYTTAELEKPFVMARIVFRPDYNDPMVKAKMIDAAIQSITGVFGPKQITESIQESQPINITPIEPDPEPDPEPGETINGDTGEVTPAPIKIPTPAEFKALADESQIHVIEIMAGKTGYDVDAYLTKAKIFSVIDMSKLKRESLFAHLCSLPEKTAESSDIPW
jgi:hypothetical protein